MIYFIGKIGDAPYPIFYTLFLNFSEALKNIALFAINLCGKVIKKVIFC